MSWFSGSGLGAILKNLIMRPDFQQSAIDFVVSAGQKLLQSKNDPAQVQKIAQNFVDSPEVIVGAIVKGTEAEGLVEPEIVQKADAEMAKPH